jgi:hypothetical protein
VKAALVAERKAWQACGGAVNHPAQ